MSIGSFTDKVADAQNEPLLAANATHIDERHTVRVSMLPSTAKTSVSELHCLGIARFALSLRPILWRSASYQHRKNFASGLASFGNEWASKQSENSARSEALRHSKPTTTTKPLTVKIKIQQA